MVQWMGQGVSRPSSCGQVPEGDFSRGRVVLELRAEGMTMAFQG